MKQAPWEASGARNPATWDAWATTPQSTDKRAAESAVQTKIKFGLKCCSISRTGVLPPGPSPALLLSLQGWASVGQDQQTQNSCCRTSANMEISQPSVCPKVHSWKGHPYARGAWTAAVQLTQGNQINARPISDKDLQSQTSIKGSLNTFPYSSDRWQNCT